jgi:hypothetical protein
MVSSWSGTIAGFFISRVSMILRPRSSTDSTSRTLATPTIRSTEPSATSSSECGLSSIAARISASLALRSIQCSSVRGVITSRTGRSASRITLVISARSSSSITPERVASAKIIWSSSAVTSCSAPLFNRSRRSSRPDERSSAHTNGALMRAISTIGRAATMAIGSAARSASCLGTSSPTTRLR